ncbi:hypothetical protein PMI37_05622, partial [Pseudomonas sp. GM80]
NPSTQPSDVARGSRSKAVLELALIVLSGEKQKRCEYLPVELNPCGSWLASDGGLSADHVLAVEVSPVGAAEGCDLLILLVMQQKQDQKFAACGSSCTGMWGKRKPPANQRSVGGFGFRGFASPDSAQLIGKLRNPARRSRKPLALEQGRQVLREPNHHRGCRRWKQRSACWC